MFLILSYMALMALGQWGEQPCPMVLFSDQMCHPMPRFTPDLVWYQVILWKDHCFTPWFSSGTWDQHCWSNRPSCAQLMLRIVICGKITWYQCHSCLPPPLSYLFDSVCLSGGCVRDVLATEEGLCFSDAGRPTQPQLHQRQAPETVLLEG